jgi:hypothetical protein
MVRRLLLMFGAYFGVGAYYNYSTYGATGADLIPCVPVFFIRKSVIHCASTDIVTFGRRYHTCSRTSSRIYAPLHGHDGHSKTVDTSLYDLRLNRFPSACHLKVELTVSLSSRGVEENSVCGCRLFYRCSGNDFLRLLSHALCRRLRLQICEPV